MKKRILALLSATLLLCGVFSTSAFAGVFFQDATGIKYLHDTGTVAANEWIQVNGLWYYMDAVGNCTNPAGSVTAPAQSQPATAINIFATAGWTPYAPTDNAILQAGLANGLIGFDGAQYWASPAFSAMLAAQVPASAPASITPAVNPQEKVVYIGGTGTKYHRDNCRTLKNGAIPINLSEALSQNRDACKVCNP